MRCCTRSITGVIFFFHRTAVMANDMPTAVAEGLTITPTKSLARVRMQ